MANYCWKCKEKIPIVARKENRYILRNTKKNYIWLHNECYMKLSKAEKKQFYYDASRSTPSGFKEYFKASGVLLFGAMGALGASEGAFSGQMWAAKRAIKKKGMTFDELDDLCIDKYNYHYPLLPDKLQNEILAELHS